MHDRFIHDRFIHCGYGWLTGYSFKAMSKFAMRAVAMSAMP
jgi:hypothetical protein